MADQWLFKSETYDNCNCAVNCGCQFNLPSTHGYCQSAFVGNIVEGHFNETPLAGLNWAGLYKWPGEIAEGNGKRQIIIDERADAAQRVALETIISGGACAPLSNFFPYSHPPARNFARHCSCQLVSKRTWKAEPQGWISRASCAAAADRSSTSLLANRSTLRWHVLVAVSSLPTQKSGKGRPR
jgi:hypothetical protein